MEKNTSNSVASEIECWLADSSRLVEEARAALRQVAENQKATSDALAKSLLPALIDLARRRETVELELTTLRENLAQARLDIKNIREPESRVVVEEAVFDAQSWFKKQCPYCGKDQYRVSFREKIEIDHFIPISRGGQNVPWNLLPVCKPCNRKKKDRLPADFLPAVVFDKCSSYLSSVRIRFAEEGVAQLESQNFLKALIEKNEPFVSVSWSNPFIQNLVQIVHPEMYQRVLLQTPPGRAHATKAADYLSGLIRQRAGPFERGVVGSPWQTLCDEIRGGAPENMDAFSARDLIQILAKNGWRDIGRIYSADFPSRKHAICAPELAGLSKSALRRMLEGQRRGHGDKALTVPRG
jgi:hypothetical protein